MVGGSGPVQVKDSPLLLQQIDAMRLSIEHLKTENNRLKVRGPFSVGASLGVCTTQLSRSLSSQAWAAHAPIATGEWTIALQLVLPRGEAGEGQCTWLEEGDPDRSQPEMVSLER